MINERDALMDPMMTPNPRDARSGLIVKMLRIGTLLGLAIVVGRVIQLQVAPGEQLSGFIAKRQTSQKLHSTRGDLLDRRGRVLATTRVGYRVIIDPVSLDQAMKRDASAIDQVIVGLGQVLDMQTDQIAERLIGSMVRNQEIRAQADTGSSTPSQAIAGLATMGVDGAGGATRPGRRLSRYLPMGSVLDQAQTQHIREAIKAGKLPAVTLEHTPVRVQVGEELVGPIVGKFGFTPTGTEKTGVLGAEKMFNDRLIGEDGSKTYVRDAKGQPLWVERGAWVESDKGQDVRLSIDLEIQRLVYDELVKGVEQADAAGGRAIVLNPHTGEILAMTDVLRHIEGLATVPWWDPDSGEPRPSMPPEDEQPRYKVLRDDPARTIEPALAYNRCLQDVYEPGSTFKPFAWTLAKSQGLLPDDEVLDIKVKSVRTPYGRLVTDAFVHSDLDGWDDVLRYSSNIGMSIATERLSFKDLRSLVKSLGFGERTGIGLGGESVGIVTSVKNWTDYTQTSVGMGYEVAVTPIQMVRGFSVFARRGAMAGTLPEVRITAAGEPNKRGMLNQETIVHRVFDAEVIPLTIEPMISVAQRMDKKKMQQYPDEPKPKYTMFGKSGTSHIAMVPPPGLKTPKTKKAYYAKQHHSSFIVAAPAEDPQIVVLVVIDDIGPERVRLNHHFGSWVAGPVVRRIVEKTLPYLGVPASPSLVEGDA
ncbi:MAG: peptidoglycan D,D-transpeptidase FtsI family protein [Phycisphaerales bacterium]